VLTRTSETEALGWAGDTAVISVPEITVNVVAGTAPNVTFDAPANPEPVIVTSVPPVVGPEPGVTLATTGAGEVAMPVPVNVI
jgi:hypothetical protein